MEIQLSRDYTDFKKPNVELEQYGTSSRVAANLVYRAFTLSDVEGKKVVDLCSGPGILGISALILGAKSCTFVEIDSQVIPLLMMNLENFGLTADAEVIRGDVRSFSGTFDTCFTNPPFGIQQKLISDTEVLQKALAISKSVYSIHDASPQNLKYIPEFVKKVGGVPLDYYLDTILLKNQFAFHTLKSKQKEIIVLRSKGLIDNFDISVPS